MALTASESYELVAKMPLHERLRLIEKISCDLAGEVKGDTICRLKVRLFVRTYLQMSKWANEQMGLFADLQICRFADLQSAIRNPQLKSRT